MNEERYNRGLEILKKINSDAGNQIFDNLKDIAPDLGRFAIEFPFGDLYTRTTLDLKSRMMVAIAALTVLGNAEMQLKGNIHGALNVGCSRQEIVEIIMQMAVHAGFPSALNGMLVAKEVFLERDKNGLS